MAFNIEVDQEVGSCVFKLYYGDKYVIIKGKSLAGSIHFFDKGYKDTLTGGRGYRRDIPVGPGQKEGTGTNTLYWKFYKHIKNNQDLEFKIEVIIESTDGYELLVAEQKELDNCIKDKNNYSSNVQAYMPKYNEKTQNYGWILKDEAERFLAYINAV